MSWNVIKKAVDNGIDSLTDDEYELYTNVKSQIEPSKWVVIKKAVDNGIDSLTDDEYELYTNVKNNIITTSDLSSEYKDFSIGSELDKTIITSIDNLTKAGLSDTWLKTAQDYFAQNEIPQSEQAVILGYLSKAKNWDKWDVPANWNKPNWKAPIIPEKSPTIAKHIETIVNNQFYKARDIIQQEQGRTRFQDYAFPAITASFEQDAGIFKTGLSALSDISPGRLIQPIISKGASEIIGDTDVGETIDYYKSALSARPEEQKLSEAGLSMIGPGIIGKGIEKGIAKIGSKVSDIGSWVSKLSSNPTIVEKGSAIATKIGELSGNVAPTAFQRTMPSYVVPSVISGAIEGASVGYGRDAGYQDQNQANEGIYGTIGGAIGGGIGGAIGSKLKSFKYDAPITSNVNDPAYLGEGSILQRKLNEAMSGLQVPVNEARSKPIDLPTFNQIFNLKTDNFAPRIASDAPMQDEYTRLVNNMRNDLGIIDESKLPSEVQLFNMNDEKALKYINENPYLITALKRLKDNGVINYVELRPSKIQSNPLNWLDNAVSTIRNNLDATRPTIKELNEQKSYLGTLLNDMAGSTDVSSGYNKRAIDKLREDIKTNVNEQIFKTQFTESGLPNRFNTNITRQEELENQLVDIKNKFDNGLISNSEFQSAKESINNQLTDLGNTNLLDVMRTGRQATEVSELNDEVLKAQSNLFDKIDELRIGDKTRLLIERRLATAFDRPASNQYETYNYDKLIEDLDAEVLNLKKLADKSDAVRKEEILAGAKQVELAVKQLKETKDILEAKAGRNVSGTQRIKSLYDSDLRNTGNLGMILDEVGVKPITDIRRVGKNIGKSSSSYLGSESFESTKDNREAKQPTLRNVIDLNTEIRKRTKK